jgi:hypothetical protein
LKRLAFSVSLLIPLLTACQGNLPVSVTQAELDAVAIATSGAIARGEVGNAISGTVELPINLRTFARLTDGAPPVTLHAFRTTGQLIREAKVSLFWRNDRSVGYVVDGVPPAHTIVLAATVEPGVVVRALVPKSSREAPSRGQVIDKTSEMVVVEAYLAGMIPPVGLGGTAEVLLQGGLNPAAAAVANTEAGEALSRFAGTEWAKTVAEAPAAATALKALAEAQAKAAEAINAGAADSPAIRALCQQVFHASLAANAKLNALKAQIDVRAAQGEPSHEAATALNQAATALLAAARTDIPSPADFVPASGNFHLAQVPTGLDLKGPFPYKALPPSQLNLGALYQELSFLAASQTGFYGPNGGPFTEAEIDEAFTSGKGPYRTSCSQISFSDTRNCTVVTNPADKSREVLITREADRFETKLLQLEAAFAANDEEKVRLTLYGTPSLLNFIADDKARWTSPVGTWRLRLLQDTGEGLWSSAGWPVLSDAEMYIGEPRNDAGEVTAVASGPFSGLIAIWMPGGTGSPDALNNFAMRFDWDDQARTLSEGVIKGERRSVVGNDTTRQDYSASFEGQMVESNRIRGYWFNDEKDMAGRFEMIRGTARYSI